MTTKLHNRITNELERRTVIRYPWVLGSIVGLLLSTVVALGLYFKYHSLILASLASAGFIRGLAERRRKIVISESGVSYWPPFSPPRRARFTDITSVHRATVSTTGAGMPYPGPGIELRLTGDEVLRIPLDLSHSQEVFEKIANAWESQREATG